MKHDIHDIITPRILVIDDEKQIHAALKLRLGAEYELAFCLDAQDALQRLGNERFDLCFVDLHMPRMDGFSFIASAREIDPCVGFVVISAFDTDENLRRAIPLQVFEFVGKPLPEKHAFERLIPDWVERSRTLRRNRGLVTQADSLVNELASARLAHEVELFASETARDALLQTTNFLTTITAHLTTASQQVSARARTDATLTTTVRNLELARKTAEAATLMADQFFGRSYGNRGSSPALIDAGIRHAIEIVQRMSGNAEKELRPVEYKGYFESAAVRGAAGIEFLLMAVAGIGAASSLASPRTAVRVAVESISRLELPTKGADPKVFLWFNRSHAITSHPGVLVDIRANGRSLPRRELEAWLESRQEALTSVPSVGLVAGIKKCRGLLGCSIGDAAEIRVALVLPV